MSPGAASPATSAALPEAGEGARSRAWRDGPLGCASGGHATLFLDRHGYVTGSAPAGPPAGWHVAELYAAECAARGDPEDDLRASRREGSIDLEGWWERADGGRCWVEATLTALRGAAGAAAGFALVMRDASAARAAEEALRLSEARLAGIVDLARDAIVSTDESREIILFNRGAERIFGHASAEMLGRPFELLLADRYRESHAGEVLALDGAAGRMRREGDLGEVAARRKDGTVFPAAASLSSVEVGGLRVFTWVLRDVSAEKRAAAEAAFLLRAGVALASSLDPASTLATAASLAAEGLADLCLAHAAEAGGHPPRTAAAGAPPHGSELARTLEALSPPLAAVEPVATALRTGTPQRMEIADAGSLRAAGWPADLAGALSRLAPGALCVLPLAVHRRAAGALVLVRGGGAGFGPEDVRLAAELAGRASLALEGALLHERALRAVRLRDDMVSVVSHDLRSPLSTVSMAAAMLAEPGALAAPPAARTKFVEMIRRSAEQMSQMVEDLLDVARIESGRLALQGRLLAPATMLAEAAQSLLPQADAAGIALDVEADDGLPEAWGDPDRLQRVLANLVGNALKFTPRGGRITLRAEAEGGAEVRVSVRDTGGGIPPGDLPFVFDRFWQASRSDRRGLGLGLPIVKGIVEAHGGRVWVESAVGRGSAFFFTLPTTPAAAAAA